MRAWLALSILIAGLAFSPAQASPGWTFCVAESGGTVTVPTLLELMAESDLFGPLTAEERGLLAEHFVPVTHEKGGTLIREGDQPETLFLLASGTVELARGHGATKQVLLRASPGDSIGMIALITGMPSIVTAAALTPITAFALDKEGIATVLRARPALTASLEALAKRGQDWLRCEAAAHENEQIAKPDMLLTRLRQFIRRINA